MHDDKIYDNVYDDKIIRGIFFSYFILFVGNQFSLTFFLWPSTSLLFSGHHSKIFFHFYERTENFFGRRDRDRGSKRDLIRLGSRF